MSRRGGGRRNESQREQPSPAAAPPRRGGGGGRGGGRGRGGRSSGTFVPSSSTQSPATYDVGSSSSAVASLSDDFKVQSTLQSPVVTETPQPPPATTTEIVPSQPPPASSKACRFPARPGFGKKGSRCLVRANHFLVDLADKDLHHYDVSVSPEVTSRATSREIMAQLVGLYCESHLGKRKPAYDGRKSLYTAGPLPFTSKEFVIKLADKDDKTKPARREREFKVAIKFASRADIHHLQQFLQSRQVDAPQETIQVLDVVLRESPSTFYTVVGRSFFSPSLGQRSEIGDGLECWKGFYQSLRPTQMGLSLNIDVSATSFYEPISVIEFVHKFLNIREWSRSLSDTDRVKIKKALRGVRVELTHRQGVRRNKISGITSLPTSQLKFPVDDKGTQVSVVQYFREKYKVELRYSHWPSIQVGSDSKPSYIPMEVCKIVEGQRYSKKLNEKQVTALLREACKRPYERERNIVQMARQNNYNNDVFAREFGIQVKDALTSIEARVLPPPMLKYHETGQETKVQPRVGQWNMMRMKMVNGAEVKHWTCVNFSSRLNQDLAFRFCMELVGMCRDKGMVFNPNPVLQMTKGRPDIEKTIVDIHSQCTKILAAVQGKLQLLLVILPDFSGSYGRIKRVCETELGIVSQCCQPRQVSKLNKQYMENVALKINVKAGGRNTVLSDAIQRKIPLVTDRPTIIFGADVTHPQPGEDSSPSIAAVVASMDWPEVTKYRGLVSAQAHREELIQDLYKVVQDPKRGLVSGGMIREHLIAFRRSTGHKPHRIIFYRDGVSEGQFSQVLLYEMDAIRKACSSLEEGYLPPVTFVVVQKRHHTRLFPAEHNNRDLTDRSGNILPGTVVDTNICHPTEFDFYLCSHAGIQGTSRPTHYHVLFDENKFSADDLQTLTNNLCYTYARCTRSVSIVPPAYYAHLAAFRARYYIEGDASDSGSGGGRNMRDRSAVVQPLPEIFDNVKDVMFYC